MLSLKLLACGVGVHDFQIPASVVSLYILGQNLVSFINTLGDT